MTRRFLRRSGAAQGAGLLTATGIVAISAATAVPAQAVGTVRPVYVAQVRGNAVAVLDPATGTATATVPVGGGPVDVAVTPDGSAVYVAAYDSGGVQVISTATDTVTATTLHRSWLTVSSAPPRTPKAGRGGCSGASEPWGVRCRAAARLRHGDELGGPHRRRGGGGVSSTVADRTPWLRGAPPLK